MQHQNGQLIGMNLSFFKVLSKFILSLILAVGFAGCATLSYDSNERGTSTPVSVKNEPIEDENDNGISDASVFDNEKMNRHIKKWVTYYSERDGERLKRFLHRGEEYREVIEDIFEQHGIPKEIYYLGIVESGFGNHARSHADAVGAWQFIAATGKRYGLEINYHVDERRDPIHAAEAAAKYLRDLYRTFGAWPLAMAAYNTGEGRVSRGILRAKSRNYWVLHKKRVIPRETRDYYPKFLAVLHIASNLEEFGIDPIEGVEKYPDVQAMGVPSPVKLSKIAEVSGIPLSVLQKVNPHLRRGITPPTKSYYEIWVPEQYVSKLKDKNSVLSQYRVKIKPRAYVDRRNYHRVRRGQTLSTIARRYRLSVNYIKRLNGLKSSRIYAGQKLRMTAKGYHRKSRRSVASGSGTFHRVRKGDTLGRIARRYRVSIRRLKNLNGLRRNTIYPGQKIKVKGATLKGNKIAKPRLLTYKVRRGDSLHRIANRFRTSIKKIKRLNGLRRNTIFPGQFLKVAHN